MSIRVVLADDHRIMREGLRDLLAKEPDLEVIGEAENGREAVRLAGSLKPDVVLMDIAMPDMSGLEATRKITAGVPGVKVLILSMYPERRFVVGALHAGASGYLLKDCAFQELAVGVRTVAAEHTYLSGRVADLITHGWMQQPEETRSSAHMVLTPREVEVLQFIAAGATTKEIAFNLNVSVKTVETHRHQIMQKLNLHSIAELTKYAVRQHLTSLEG